MTSRNVLFVGILFMQTEWLLTIVRVVKDFCDMFWTTALFNYLISRLIYNVTSSLFLQCIAASSIALSCLFYYRDDSDWDFGSKILTQQWFVGSFWRSLPKNKIFMFLGSIEPLWNFIPASRLTRLVPLIS